MAGTVGVPNSKIHLLWLLSVIQQKKNPVTVKKEDFSIAEQMNMVIITKAKQEDVRAYKEVMDRLEGFVTAPTENHHDKQITVRIVKTGKDLADETYLD